MSVCVYKLNLSVLGFIIITIIAYSTTRSRGESSTCLTVYKEGGAPAVFQSPKCPLWKLPDYNSPPRTTSGCQSAMLQGRRKYQEDRTLCALDLHIPFPGYKTSLFLFRLISRYIYFCMLCVLKSGFSCLKTNTLQFD